jgi:hypothetical protein
MMLPELAGARNWQRQAACNSVLESCHGLLGVRCVSHRSTHSTNAGGISLRTIITRTMRSSWRSVVVPRLADSSVGYRADAADKFVAVPRLIVAISLNIL